MSNVPSNTDDVIDSREVIARIEELESERDGLQTNMAEACMGAEQLRAGDDADTSEVEEAEVCAQSARDALRAWDEGSGGELHVLKALADEGERLADWAHGETLVRDSHFQTYAQELADDLGLIPSDAGWPSTCIDWEQAARELKMDYTSVEFDGVTYWGRS